MSLICYDEGMSEHIEPYKKTTILFPVRNPGIILGMKKRGHGKGWWNGFGGKLNEDETYEEAARRETFEESGIHIETLLHVANLHFYFGNALGVVSRVYVSKNFTGQPIETDEMRPELFAINQIPYDAMWPADKLWLPDVLEANAPPLGFVVHFDDDNRFTSIENVDAELLETKF